MLGIGEPPSFDLNNDSAPDSPTASTAQNTANNARRPSNTSTGSSRSASFSLPNKAYPVHPGQPSSPTNVIQEPVGATYANTAGNRQGSVSGSSVFADSDEEGMDEEQRAHKRDFEKKRAKHYGQEAALALKKAREMEEDEEEDEGTPVPPVPNGK